MHIDNRDLANIVARASTLYDRTESSKIRADAAANHTSHKRRKKWCELVAGGDQREFEKRLAWDGLDAKRLGRVLSSQYRIRNDDFPPWADTLRQVLLAADPSDAKAASAGEEPLPFEEVLSPFINTARRELVARAAAAYELLACTAHKDIERFLQSSLSQLSCRPLQLEFSLFRAQKQSSLVRMIRQRSPDLSRDVYNTFVAEMLHGGLRSFFHEYSALARLMAVVTRQWVDGTAEFLERLARDLSEIHLVFSNRSDPGRVVEVAPGLSDCHHGSRSVYLLTFESGLRLLYKPRDLGLDEAFWRLTQWLNDHGISHRMRALKVLNHGTHGWTEYVERFPCNNTDEARRYYQRAGVLLGILYALDATDIHHENIIASGEYPILIDMETLTCHEVSVQNHATESEANQYQVEKQLWDSVLKTGLLSRWWLGAGGQVEDVSGFGSEDDPERSYRVPKWEHINTDKMELTSQYVRPRPAANMPSMGGRDLLPDPYRHEITQGFRDAYGFVLKHKKEILAPQGPLVQFAHRQVRFIFRPTQVYDALLKQSLRPTCLREGIDRSIELDVLARAMLASDAAPPQWVLLREEVAALERTDIPHFVASSSSGVLRLSDETTVPDLFVEPSYSRLVARMCEFNEQDMRRQISVINAAFCSRIVRGSHESRADEDLPVSLNNVERLMRHEKISASLRIASELQRLATYTSDDNVSFLTLEYVPEARRYQLQPTSYSLYSGCTGIALFLAALEKTTGGAGFRDLCLGAVRPLCQSLQDRRGASTLGRLLGIGGALGLGGVIYGLARIGQFLSSDELVESAELAQSLVDSELVGGDALFDVLGGGAGTILGLLALYDVSGDAGSLDVAVQIGNHLLSNRVTTDAGYRVWVSSGGPDSLHDWGSF